MTDIQDVLTDLNTDCDEIDRLVSGLEESQWQLPTPAPGWTIAHQIAHLTATFQMAATAAADPAAFKAFLSGISNDFAANVAAAMAPFLALRPAELLSRWQAERAHVTEALAAVPEGEVVPWLVRPLPPVILACAGIMEAFAHGQDIADALGEQREQTDRLKHLVIFAALVWDFGYQARGMTPPDVQFGYVITAPSGEVWTFGPPDATQVIEGPAADFCLLVTRRRHRDDLSITATGADADQWLDIAQAYRGPAGEGRTPGQFAAARR
ncbi:MAG TPA: TIGR03084 family metal-binding protein [Streptosporangiaceae bacterium]